MMPPLQKLPKELFIMVLEELCGIDYGNWRDQPMSVMHFQ